MEGVFQTTAIKFGTPPPKKNERLMKKAEEVVSIITGGCIKSLDDFKSGGQQIKLGDMDMKKQLLPRFHLTALVFLLESNYFEDEANT